MYLSINVNSDWFYLKFFVKKYKLQCRKLYNVLDCLHVIIPYFNDIKVLLWVGVFFVPRGGMWSVFLWLPTHSKRAQGWKWKVLIKCKHVFFLQFFIFCKRFTASVCTITASAHTMYSKCIHYLQLVHALCRASACTIYSKCMHYAQIVHTLCTEIYKARKRTLYGYPQQV